MTSYQYLRIGTLCLMVLAGACTPRRVAAPSPAPPQPAKQPVFALLPERDGTAGAIVVNNPAGSQELTQPYQAVKVERADIAPSAPFTLDQADARRLFGLALDALPAPELVFVLHFDAAQDVLNAASEAQVPAILSAIRERRSTAITVIGHTDTTSTPASNYELGLRRARNVADILLRDGVNPDNLFVSSHGETDLLEKTERGISNAQNRRVEVIVR